MEQDLQNVIYYAGERDLPHLRHVDYEMVKNVMWNGDAL